jgi:hypothetical protein
LLTNLRVWSISDIFDDLMNPSSSAAALLTAAVKRQGQLPKTLEFIVQVLNTSQDPREQDGALHMVGSLAPNLLKVCRFSRFLWGCPQITLPFEMAVRSSVFYT